ncbi:hypothetical protein LINPERPRIM_LOCUS23849, partial [Linum perenne]
GIKDVEVQTNSSCAIKLLLEEDPIGNQHANIVARFKNMMTKDCSVRLKHIYREVNFMADHLANKGHNLTFGVHSLICHGGNSYLLGEV